MAARALDSWGSDVVALHEASGGHSLLLLGESLLNRHNLIEHFDLDRHTVRRFLAAAEMAYAATDSAKCYHTSIHGADVALSTHLFLTKFGQLERLSKVQLLAVLVAAMMHDFNHPGTTNAHEAFLGIAAGKRTSTWHEQEVKDLGTGLAGRRVEAQQQGHRFATKLKPLGFMSIQARERWSTTEEVHVRPGHHWVAQVK